MATKHFLPMHLQPLTHTKDFSQQKTISYLIIIQKHDLDFSHTKDKQKNNITDQ